MCILTHIASFGTEATDPLLTAVFICFDAVWSGAAIKQKI